MGLTIHIEGQLKSEKDFNELMVLATNYAFNKGFRYNLFIEKENILCKIKNGKLIDGNYLVKCIVINPGDGCESLIMEFDEELHFQTSCKTQFADPEIHMELVGFLRKIEPFFEFFTVQDEGEFWETGDAEILRSKINFLNQMMDSVQKYIKEQNDNRWKYN